MQSGGKMAKFKELGFKDFDDYKNYFFSTLLLSNKTYEYFVDWKKVKKAVNKYIDELSLLNSLSKISQEDREEHLKDLLLKYPKIIEVIPLLIAERLKKFKVDIFDPEIEEIISFEFYKSKVNSDNLTKIIEFCKKTGIFKLFQEVKDIHDYLLGVEVGLDTNARKNRSGKIFERMCQQKVKNLVSENYKMIVNDPNFSLYPAINSGRSGEKTHDIVIYKDDSPVLVVECNFYNVSGSKPISIAESYIKMHETAQENKIAFLWITDGPAWLEMEGTLLRNMNSMDWILNFKMLNLITKILDFIN